MDGAARAGRWAVSKKGKRAGHEARNASACVRACQQAGGIRGVGDLLRGANGAGDIGLGDGGGAAGHISAYQRVL